MKKTILLTPGPTPVPEEVLQILAQPMIHHRTPYFKEVFSEVRENLKWIFQTQSEVLCLTSSGTGAMEAAISNLFSPGESVITLIAGKFGKRWSQIAQTYQLHSTDILIDPSQPFPMSVLEATYKKNPQATAVLFQASETSTGMKLPTQEIASFCKKNQLLSVCDAITACGVFHLPMDAWEIDVMMTGSQKAMMIPPGLAMIALSKRAWEKTPSAKLPKFYFDLTKELKAHQKNQTSWTPAISLILGLQESLRIMKNEGLENMFKRHQILTQATRNALMALNLSWVAQHHPSEAVTAVWVPTEIKDGKKIPSLMRDQYGVIIAGGQDEFEGKIFRLSHFGHCSPSDIISGITALELTLKELGFSVESEKGVKAAQAIFSQEGLSF